MSIFYKLRTKLGSSILRMIYFAFVHSHLLYGVEVYANTTNHLSKLITLNNKLLRILQYKSLKTYNSELYKTYFTLPLELLHNFKYYYLFKNMCTIEVSCLLFFSTYFEENKLLHCHDTRQKNDFHTYAVQSEIGKKTINIGAVSYGTIYLMTSKTLGPTSLLSFKYKLKSYLLHTLQQ